MVRYMFKRVGFKITVKAKTKSGKTRQRTRHFYQTQNPWNDKTAEQIMVEEKEKATKWRLETIKEIEKMP